MKTERVNASAALATRMTGVAIPFGKASMVWLKPRIAEAKALGGTAEMIGPFEDAAPATVRRLTWRRLRNPTSQPVRLTEDVTLVRERRCEYRFDAVLAEAGDVRCPLDVRLSPDDAEALVLPLDRSEGRAALGASKVRKEAGFHADPGREYEIVVEQREQRRSGRFRVEILMDAAIWGDFAFADPDGRPTGPVLHWRREERRLASRFFDDATRTLAFTGILDIVEFDDASVSVHEHALEGHALSVEDAMMIYDEKAGARPLSASEAANVADRISHGDRDRGRFADLV